jgi:hypothetical protein
MRPLLLAVLLLSATTARADSGVTIGTEPPDPTSNHPVTLLVTQLTSSCAFAPVVTRSGSTFDVTLGSPFCPGPPQPPVRLTFRLDLGTLSAGTWDVTVSDGTKATFTVLDANDSIVVGPSIGPIGGSSVVVTADVPGTPAIAFDGIALNVIRAADRTFSVTTPPHAAGAVLVTVTSGSTTLSSYAFRYYDPAAPPLPELFAKILIPVFYDGTGLFGSSWVTDVVVTNDNPYDVPVYSGPDVPVLPAGVPKIVSFSTGLRGVIMMVPREAEPEIQVNALIRDTSRPLDSPGTELPTVRESQVRNRITLPNVPVDPRFRNFLRIYSLSRTFSVPVHVTAVSMTDGSLVGERNLQLTNLDPSSQPGWVATLNFPKIAQPSPGQRVAIHIDSLSEPIWAFVTVTNNETQDVTVISAQ